MTIVPAVKVRAKRGTRSMINNNVATWQRAQAKKRAKRTPAEAVPAPFNAIRWR